MTIKTKIAFKLNQISAIFILFGFLLQIFILRVERVNQKVPMYVFRHFSEFLEFRNKVVELFPLTSWPPNPSKQVHYLKIKFKFEKLSITELVKFNWSVLWPKSVIKSNFFLYISLSLSYKMHCWVDLSWPFCLKLNLLVIMINYGGHDQISDGTIKHKNCSRSQKAGDGEIPTWIMEKGTRSVWGL